MITKLTGNSKLEFFSTLQMNDDVHLSLSPTGSPVPKDYDEATFEDIDLNTKHVSNTIPDGFKVAYRDHVKSEPMPRSASWYEGFFGCLKPVMSFISKGKPSSSDSEAQGKVCLHLILAGKFRFFDTFR